jgi:hypothetical protein
MDVNFHLIDLVSQALAVQSLLRGMSAEEKLAWLSSRGTLTPVPKIQTDYPQSFWFETTTGLSCAFFLDGDEFVFIGDHSTLTVSDSSC